MRRQQLIRFAWSYVQKPLWMQHSGTRRIRPLCWEPLLSVLFEWCWRIGLTVLRAGRQDDEVQYRVGHGAR